MSSYTLTPFVKVALGQQFRMLTNDGEPGALCVRIGNDCGSKRQPEVRNEANPFDGMTINAAALEPGTQEDGTFSAGQVMRFRKQECVAIEQKGTEQ